MKRFLIIVVLLAAMLVPAVGQAQTPIPDVSRTPTMEPAGWPGVFPIEWLGEIIGADTTGFVVPRMTCYAPWGTAWDNEDGTCAEWNQGLGYVATFKPDVIQVWDGDAVAMADAVAISMTGMTTPRGREFGMPPSFYVPVRWVLWNPDCGCYLYTEELSNGLLYFEAWSNYGWNELGKYRTGCLKNTGSFGPWWEVTTQCVYSESDIGPVPNFENKRKGSRRME